MRKYIISIEEIVTQEFEVEADSAEEAMRIAEKKYKKCEFVLEPGALISKQMAIMDPDNEFTEWREF